MESLMLYMENVKHLRDKVIIKLLLFTGVRVSELFGKRIRDIDFLSHQPNIIGKGGKYQEISVGVNKKQSLQIRIPKYANSDVIGGPSNEPIYH